MDLREGIIAMNEEQLELLAELVAEKVVEKLLIGDIATIPQESIFIGESGTSCSPFYQKFGDSADITTIDKRESDE